VGWWGTCPQSSVQYLQILLSIALLDGWSRCLRKEGNAKLDMQLCLGGDIHGRAEGEEVTFHFPGQTLSVWAVLQTMERGKLATLGPQPADWIDIFHPKKHLVHSGRRGLQARRNLDDTCLCPGNICPSQMFGHCRCCWRWNCLARSSNVCPSSPKGEGL